ncbi:MAG: GNAT family N-acetyltransferase [Anaeromyxobacteraceae bacterium]
MSPAASTALRLRLATEADAPAVADIYRPAVTDGWISFETEPPDAAEMAGRIRGVLALMPWLVCERASDGLVVGYAYASRHRERAAYRFSVDLAVYVRDGWRGKGIGRALYDALLPMLRAQGYRAAHAGVSMPNPGSVALHEAIGMRRIALYPKVGFKLGGWRDVGWWQVELLPREGEPSEPRSLRALLEDPAFRAALREGERRLG